MGRPFKTAFITFGAVLLLAVQAFGAGEPPFLLPKPKEISRVRTAILYTNRGKILLELFPNEAPWHVANFKYLADKGFYRNLKFHIYMPGYIIQGGDPTGTGNGGPGYFLPPEYSNIEHTKGMVGMSRRPDEINPERLSNGSQFHIMLGDAPHMNNKYTIFGKVIRGMEVVEQLRRGDTIEDLKVFVQR